MRGKRAKIKRTERDSRYKSVLFTRFINAMMLHGKKSLAEKMFYAIVEDGAKELKTDPVEFVTRVIDNVRPALEIKSRRVGGSNYQVPVPVSPQRQETLAIRWLIEIARKKTGASFTELLQKEMIAAYKGEGDVLKKKQDVERMAEANKAFAHFRW
jgi:small subunit ribosomal protein S7